MNTNRQNVLSPKRRRRTVPVAELSVSEMSLTAKSAVAETSCRRNGIAEWASPKRRRRNVLDRHYSVEIG